jgi:hypothetical protein
MIGRLLPRVIDNSYRGRTAALWILGLVAFIKIAMSLNSIFNGAFVLISADGVPLQTYPPDAAQALIALFALWAWAHLLFALLACLVLVRYRRMTALVFTLLLAEHLGRKLILQFLPIIRIDNPAASYFNWALLTLMIIGLLMSLWQRRDAHVAGPSPALPSSES